MTKPNHNSFLINQARRKFIKQGLAIASSVSITACGGGSSSTSMSSPVIITPDNTNDTPGALTQTSEPQNIVIIGAGMSGLIAGYELRRAGHQVTILEARSRVGGRVNTIYNAFDNGQFAEAGASRIPSDHNLTLAYIQHFNLAIDPFYPTTNNYFYLQNNVYSVIAATEHINQPPWPGSVNRREFFKIRGGMSNLPLALSTDLSDNINYDSPVESIEQTNDSVTIYTTNNTQYLADKILCTVPLTVLNKIAFSPTLSNEKSLASNGGYDYTDSTRLYTQFSERFWLSNNLNGWGDTDWPEEIWQPTWDHESNSGIIQSYLRNNTASELDMFDPLQQVENVHTRWQHVFPQLKDFIVTNHVHSWQKEPWTGSAYASPTSTQNAALAAHIGAAEGRIHFAGEHASQFHGWIQGAIESGIRAANEIHNLT